jgi:hypothetical protein
MYACILLYTLLKKIAVFLKRDTHAVGRIKLYNTTRIVVVVVVVVKES